METLIGKTLNRYTILTLLGEGDIGAVYRAWDTALQRDVAMKILSPEYAQRPDFQERFVQEARLAARLDHPSIVKVHDFGKAALPGEEGETAPGGEPQYLFIVMEYIPGDNLSKMLNDLRLHKQWVVLTEAVQIVHQIAQALEYAHNQGVVHLDIKPSNLMLKPDAEKSAESSGGLPYRVVITDLGLAQLASAPQAGAPGSSMAYMSPEQALGQKTDARSDVYSLGILLYELSVGRVPFPARTIEEAARYHAKEAVPLPRSIRPDLPATLERAILKALHKDPARRYSSAAEFAQALEAFLPTIHEVAFRPEEVTQTVSLLTQYEAALADYVEVLLADHVLRSVRMQPGGLTIGRESDNDIVLDNIKVSRHHARITYDGISYWVADLNSKNGTFLPDGRLNPNQPTKWRPNEALQIGDFQLYLRRFTPDTQPPPGQATPRPSAARPAAAETMVQTGPIADAIDLFLETVQLSVIPGNRVTTHLTAINRGSLADRLRISVSGIPANWIPNPPPVLRLAPGAQQEIELAIYPPVSSQTRPGRYPLTIRAASLEAANRLAEAEAILTVGVFTQFTSELESPEVWADDRAQVKVEHRGNARQAYTITPSSREISFDPPQAQVTLGPGETATVEFTPVPRQRPVFGSASVHPFSVKVAASGAQPQIHHGKVYASALFPVWVLPVLLILCLCAASVGAYGVIDIFQRPARATQTALAGTQVAFLTQTAVLDAANQATRQAITATAAWNMQDTDGDGLPNGEELRLGTNPNIPDSDGDTIPDGFEVYQFKCTDPLNPDTDRDGLRDNQDPDPCNASSPTPTRATPTPTNTPIVIVVTATPKTVTATITATPPAPSSTPTQQIPPTPLGGSRLIVFASNRDGNYEIYAMLNDGTRQTRVTNHPADDRSPALSRSGLRTVFVSNRDGNDEIYVMNVDGSDQARLTDHPAADTNPAWSPDGNRIAFVSDRDGNKEIYVMNVNGSGVTRLTNNEVEDDHPSWSPDGSRIVFDTITASGSSINLINADGSGLSAVVDNEMINQEPVFSPDGSRIAYVSSGTGNFEIYLVNPNGSGQTQLTNLGLNAFSPDWSNDGFWLVFASRLSEQREIYRIDANGRNPINLTNNAVDDADPTW